RIAALPVQVRRQGPPEPPLGAHAGPSHPGVGGAAWSGRHGLRDQRADRTVSEAVNREHDHMIGHLSAQPTAQELRLDQCCINTMRTLSMDAVQQTNSGHPGTPMAMAPVADCLWQRFPRFDPEHPIWPNRDRFVLSAGHASMLLYSLLHLTGVKAV